MIRKITKMIPDKMYIQMVYFKHFHKFVNFKNPKTFNEKLQWLKLYDRKPIYTAMVDKVEAKKYVASKIGEEYIIPTLGVWDDPHDIDFDQLPDSFVLKWNHDSGSVIICRDKANFDCNAAIRKLSKNKEQNGYWYGREWPYKNVSPKIIAEKYMEDTSTGEMRDYKFFCFNGQAKCFKVDFNRFIEHHANYFNMEGALLNIGEQICPPSFEKAIEIPLELNKMKKLAEQLSEETTFLRADFYDVNGEIYFGELTFYPASGFGKFICDSNDGMLGKWLELPTIVGGGVRTDSRGNNSIV